jgi:hypothetical protein
MNELITPLLVTLHALTGRLHTGTRQRLGQAEGEDGVSTLEMVIITLGLIAVAGLLVAAITAAVTSRTAQIK